MTFDPNCVYCQKSLWSPMQQIDYNFVDQVVQTRLAMHEVDKSLSRSEENLRALERPEKPRSASAPSSLVSMNKPKIPNNSEIPNSCCAWIKYPFIKILECIRKILCAIWGLCGHEED